MDNIIVEGIECQVHIGVPKRERNARQLIKIDLDVTADLDAAAESDSLRKTIDYKDLFRSVRNTAENNKYALVETLAERICSVILEEFPVYTVAVRLRKYPKSLQNQVESVGVLVCRSRKTIKGDTSRKSDKAE
jgi:dihydroneopterin aldolase